MERIPQRAEARGPEEGWSARVPRIAGKFFPGQRTCECPKKSAETIPPTTPPRKRSTMNRCFMNETMPYEAGEPQFP